MRRVAVVGPGAALLAAIAAHAPTARVCVLRTPRAVRRFLASARRQAARGGVSD